MRIEIDVSGNLFYSEELFDIESINANNLQQRYSQRKEAIRLAIESISYKIEHIKSTKNCVKTYIVLQSKMNKN